MNIEEKLAAAKAALVPQDFDKEFFTKEYDAAIQAVDELEAYGLEKGYLKDPATEKAAVDTAEESAETPEGEKAEDTEEIKPSETF